MSEPVSEQTIGVIVGSNSSTSINRRLARAITALVPEGVTLVDIPITDLGFYSIDLDADPPQAAVDFKRAIDAVDGIIIVTPEYSRSIPGVLKNALDWVARPYGQNSLSGKPVAIIGASGSQISTAAAQQHLRAILGHFDAPTMGQPEGFVQMTPGLIDDDFRVTVPATEEFLRGWLAAAVDHVALHS